jgi:hypothetical protein
MMGLEPTTFCMANASERYWVVCTDCRDNFAMASASVTTEEGLPVAVPLRGCYGTGTLATICCW